MNLPNAVHENVTTRNALTQLTDASTACFVAADGTLRKPYQDQTPTEKVFERSPGSTMLSSVVYNLPSLNPALKVTLFNRAFISGPTSARNIYKREVGIVWTNLQTGGSMNCSVEQAEDGTLAVRAIERDEHLKVVADRILTSEEEREALDLIDAELATINEHRLPATAEQDTTPDGNRPIDSGLVECLAA